MSDVPRLPPQSWKAVNAAAASLAPELQGPFIRAVADEVVAYLESVACRDEAAVEVAAEAAVELALAKVLGRTLQ